MSGKFCIPELVMPSDESLRKSSIAWLEMVEETFINKWPNDLAKLSMPTKLIAFPWDGLDDMLEPGEARHSALVECAKEIDAAIGWKRHFPRLNSRSPKDAVWPFEKLAILSGKDVIDTFGRSERILDDLCYFRRIKDISTAYICLREWQYGLRQSEEYRCFVKEGELIAVTAYDYSSAPNITDDAAKQLRGRIDSWFKETLKPALHMETVVFDVWAKYDGTFLLIEINPYGLSDPCFFKTYKAVENASSYIQITEVE